MSLNYPERVHISSAQDEERMAEQQRRRTKIWWLSGMLVLFGVCIASFAAMEQFTVTLIAVGLAAVVTVVLGIVLVKADR